MVNSRHPGKRHVRRPSEEPVFDAVILVLATLALIASAYPLYFVLIASVSNPSMTAAGKVILFPRGLTFEAYSFILADSRLWNGYLNTIVYTVGTVVIGLLITIPGAYALSRKDFVGGKLIVRLLTLTMFFQGGLIPTYLIVNQLGLTNTRIVVILLSSCTVFNVIVARTFFQGIPTELYEAASVDGCGNIRFFIEMVVPLSTTIIAVIALYLAVAQWNSYFNALSYLNDTSKAPLQIELRRILVLGESLLGGTDDLPAEQIEYMRTVTILIKYAVIVVASAPIIALYPFLQRYFVKGIMVGSLKG